MFSLPRFLIAATMFVMMMAGELHAEMTPPDYIMTGTLRLPGPTRWDYLTIDALSHRLFVTRYDRVDVLDTLTQKISGTIPDLEGVHGVALAPTLNKGFVSEGRANKVTVFDLKTLKTLGSFPTGAKPDALVYDDYSQRVFVADGESGDLTVVDAGTYAALGRIALGGAPEFAVTDGKGHLYVNLEDKAEIVVLDTKTLRLMERYTLGPACEGPVGLAIDPDHMRLFPACANKAMLVLDAENGKILDTLAIGEHSDAVVFDPTTGEIFSANGNDGTLTVAAVASDGHYKVVQTVDTKISARTAAIDPGTHTLYLSAADTEGFEMSAKQSSERRPHIKSDSFMIVIVGPAR